MKELIPFSSPEYQKIRKNSEAYFEKVGKYEVARFKNTKQILENRVKLEAAYESYPTYPGVSFQSIDLNPDADLIPTELNIPDNQDNDNIIFYIHGGGFVEGNITSSRQFASCLAHYTKTRVLTISYTLFPEATGTEMINQCLEVYLNISKKFAGSKISLIGDSAGGYLSLEVLIHLIKQSAQLPLSISLASPVTDGSNSLKRDYKIDDFIVGDQSGIGEILVPGISKEELTSPEISPCFYDFKKWVPTFLIADQNEVFFADADAIYQKIEAQGWEIDFYITQNGNHDPIWAGDIFPEAKYLIQKNSEFIRKFY